MNGTKAPQTLAMLFTPPMMTTAVMMQMMPPMTQGDTAYDWWVMVDMALACTVLPMPNEAKAVNREKSMAIFFQPRPRSRAYIGPPSMLPEAVFTRYLMAKRPSEYLVAMPNTPVSQHQNTAPGPPMAMAVATPTMLPVPMVAARAVARAPNCDTSPVDFLSGVTDSLMAFNSLRWGNFRRNER